MSPEWRAPISTIQNVVLSSHCKIVSGAPISLLNEPAGATVLPIICRRCESKSLVVVFPCEPVIPITIKSDNSSRTCCANFPSATTTSGTTMQGSLTWRSVRLNTAPCLLASVTKSWPSTFSPLRARNSEPLPHLRESTSTEPVTTIFASPCRTPPVMRAISLAFNVITQHLQ